MIHAWAALLPAVVCAAQSLPPVDLGATRELAVALTPSGVTIAAAADRTVGARGARSSLLLLDRDGRRRALAAVPEASGPPALAARDGRVYAFWPSHGATLAQELDAEGALISESRLPWPVTELRAARAAGAGAWLLVGRLAGAGMEGHLGGRAALVDHGALADSWSTPPAPGAFLDLVRGGHGWLRLDGERLAYCLTAERSGGQTWVVCPDQLLRFDQAGVMVSRQPLAPPAAAAAAAGARLWLLQVEAGRACLAEAGHAPSDCFAGSPPFALAASGGEVAVAWSAGGPVQVRLVHCGAPAPSTPAAPAPASPAPACVPEKNPPPLAAHEVTNREYRRCVAARRCSPARGNWSHPPELPVDGVTRDQAAAYCAFAGARLPSDGEWSAAAHADCRAFPWGDDALGGGSNCIRRESGYRLRPPGSSRDDVVRGVYDLHGNALEWTDAGTVRGSRYCALPLGASEPPPADGWSRYLGFRCLKGASEAR